ncbi:trans-sialidase, putative, partial [Trypanosoma cruzi]
LSRVAAVMAPRTHNRRRVTGSSGRRREGRESEPQRPNMSRRVFDSTVLLLLVVMMCFCGGGATAVENGALVAAPNFAWRGVTDDKETVDSLGVPGLLKVGTVVFAVAEAQCKKGGEGSFTGIASELLTDPTDKNPVEIMNDAKKDTQFLEDGTSEVPKKKVDVSRPTTVVKGNDIYMLAGKHSRGDATGENRDAGDWGLLLVKGEVSADENKKIEWKNTEIFPRALDTQPDSWTKLIGSGGSGVLTDDGRLVLPVEGTKKGDAQNDVKNRFANYTQLEGYC